jgi:hypothetical protein
MESLGCFHTRDDSLCQAVFPHDVCNDWVCQALTTRDLGCVNLGGFGVRECDGNPCTGEICDILTHHCVVGFFRTGACDDQNPCTSDDRCGSGTCHGTAFCDDANACTDDSCDPTTLACSNTNNANPCSDGNSCTTGDVCGNGSCQSGPPATVPTTCGLGACQRTIDACAGGVPQQCVPGTPTSEVCNGIDDDCDGLTDENRVQADCTVSPSTINIGSQGSTFSMTCKLLDVCDPANPVPISGSTVSPVYVSRVDSANDPGDDVTLPDPSTLPCPDPVLGSLYERGIVENLAARDVSNANVTFKFNLPADGDCATLDGNRQDIAARLSAVPDNTSATVCISGKTGGADVQACVLVLVKNKGLR